MKRSMIALVALALLTTACQASADVVAIGSPSTSDETVAVPPTPTAESPEAAPTVDSSDSPDAPAPATEPGQARFTVQGELPLSDAEVNELMAFIEEDTGRPFLRPPVIVAQSTEDFVAALADDIIDVEEDADISIRTLQALGLTDQGVAEATQAFLDLLLSPEGILGYYDPEVDKLFVPIDASGGDEFRSLLVHELTHALDGQYVGIEVFEALDEQAEETGNFERLFTLRAVAEGRATSVQNRWQREVGYQPPIPENPEAIDSVPAALVLSLGLPYAFGEQFIESNGGAANTWDLLERPPPASEDFLVFGGDTSGQSIVDVPAPTADGPVLEQAVFGAVDVFVWLLGESLEPADDLIFPALNAIDGWAGGTAVLWGDDSESCMRIALAADSAQDLEEMRSAVNTWVQSGPNRSLDSDGDLITVTGCAAYLP